MRKEKWGKPEIDKEKDKYDWAKVDKDKFAEIIMTVQGIWGKLLTYFGGFSYDILVVQGRDSCPEWNWEGRTL